MAKKNIADKYWIYGEDAELAARLTSYLTRVVYNQRANYMAVTCFPQVAAMLVESNMIHMKEENLWK